VASSKVVVEVEDSGVGIAEDEIPRIFDRFFRADQARSREVRGSGLGLSIARWIAEAHDGRIEVASRLGAGSCFRIIFPMSSVATRAAIPEAQLRNSEIAMS
jgi:signal transduction histidine kinase